MSEDSTNWSEVVSGEVTMVGQKAGSYLAVYEETGLNLLRSTIVRHFEGWIE